MKNPASIGQAINLAAADARHHNRESDVRYIYKRYVFWTALCEVIQGGEPELIQTAIDDPDFDKVIEQLKQTFGEKS